jgi:hypothetical protein
MKQVSKVRRIGGLLRMWTGELNWGNRLIRLSMKLKSKSRKLLKLKIALKEWNLKKSSLCNRWSN